jgi:hypothetical protein
VRKLPSRAIFAFRIAGALVLVSVAALAQAVDESQGTPQHSALWGATGERWTATGRLFGHCGVSSWGDGWLKGGVGDSVGWVRVVRSAL